MAHLVEVLQNLILQKIKSLTMVKAQVVQKSPSDESPKTFSKRYSVEEKKPIWCTFRGMTDERKEKIKLKIVDMIKNPHWQEGRDGLMWRTHRFTKNLMVGTSRFRGDLSSSGKRSRVLVSDCTSVLDFHPPEDIPVVQEGEESHSRDSHCFQVLGREGHVFLQDIVKEQNLTLPEDKKIHYIVTHPRCIHPSIWATHRRMEKKFAKRDMLKHASSLGFRPLCMIAKDHIDQKWGCTQLTESMDTGFHKEHVEHDYWVWKAPLQ